MDKNTSLIIPTVHLNGTSGADLMNQYSEAADAINAAINKLPFPHGRDYYVQGDDVQRKAAEQLRAWVKTLSRIQADLHTIAEGIYDQTFLDKRRTTTAASAEPQVSESETARSR